MFTFNIKSIIDLCYPVVKRSLHKLVRFIIFCELRKACYSVVICSQLAILLAELSISDELKEFDLLEDKEVHPCDVVSDDELLVAQELLDLLHSV